MPRADILTYMQDIEAVLGGPLLGYLLGTDDAGLPAAPTAEQSAVIEFLQQSLAKFQTLDASGRMARLQEVLLAYQEEQDTTLVNVLRSSVTGKQNDRGRIDDPVAEELLRLARDGFAGYLFPGLGQYGMVLASSSGNILRHPANYRFMRRVISDPALTRLFPDAQLREASDDNELVKIYTYIIVSSGHGGGLQLSRLADQLLKNSYDRMALSGNVDVDIYLDTVLSVLEEMRSLALGKQVEIPVGVGLANIKLLTDQRIGIRGAELRSTGPQDGRWLLPLNMLASVVLITTIPLQLLQVGGNPPTEPATGNISFDKYEPAFDVARKALQRRIELVRFALLLASLPGPYFASQQDMTRIFDPFYQTAIASAPTFSPSLNSEVLIDPLSFPVIESWILKTRNHPRTLDIAMRRLLSAATSRSNPLDGLIDAVLAWENMFSGTPETTLRVCGAISHLLEQADYQKRQQFFDELKKLYATRSSLVHGSSEPEIREASLMRDRAVDIGLQCMARLYDYPDLLDLKSTVRSRNILLGATQQSAS